jgi:hypothetical protein
MPLHSFDGGDKRRQINIVKDIFPQIITASIVGVAIGYVALTSALAKTETELSYIKEDLRSFGKVIEVQQAHGEAIARLDMQIKHNQATTRRLESHIASWSTNRETSSN